MSSDWGLSGDVLAQDAPTPTQSQDVQHSSAARLDLSVMDSFMDDDIDTEVLLAAAASAEVERATASCSTVSEVQDERSLDIVSPERARLLPPVQPQATVAFPEVSADAVPEADIATAATTASPSETESVVQDTPVESANSAVVEPSLVFTPADAAPAPSLPEPDVLPDAVVLVPAPAAFSESPAEQPESQPAAISSELIAEPLAAADAAPLPDLTPTSQLSDSSTPSSEPAPRRGRLSLQKKRPLASASGETASQTQTQTQSQATSQDTAVALTDAPVAQPVEPVSIPIFNAAAAPETVAEPVAACVTSVHQEPEIPTPESAPAAHAAEHEHVQVQPAEQPEVTTSVLPVHEAAPVEAVAQPVVAAPIPSEPEAATPVVTAPSSSEHAPTVAAVLSPEQPPSSAPSSQPSDPPPAPTTTPARPTSSRSSAATPTHSSSPEPPRTPASKRAAPVSSQEMEDAEAAAARSSKRAHYLSPHSVKRTAPPPPPAPLMPPPPSPSKSDVSLDLDENDPAAVQRRQTRREVDLLEADLQRVREEERHYRTRLDMSINYDTEVNKYIELLHAYNDLKDAGQALIGKLAELEGTTSREMYERYDLDLKD